VRGGVGHAGRADQEFAAGLSPGLACVPEARATSAGERLHSIDQGRDRARHWCERDYGMRRHTRTQRLPEEHFEAEEQRALLPAPSEPYDVPLRCEPKVARDHFAQVAKAHYTLPTRFIGKTLRARVGHISGVMAAGLPLTRKVASATPEEAVNFSVMWDRGPLHGASKSGP
jgi:hypothetical protein